MGDPGDIDCFIAMIASLVSAQISNDSGGTRWTRPPTSHGAAPLRALADDYGRRLRS